MSGQRRGRRAVRGVAALCAALFFVVAWGLRFAVEPVTVVSTSMEPTLQPGQRLVMEKVSVHLRGPLRGELVVVRDPHGGAPLVKRVVGLSGDTVAIDEGRLLVNSVAVGDDPGVADTEVAEFFGPVEVPAGSVFVLGDNRATSDDSREFGPIALGDVIGRVWLGT